MLTAAKIRSLARRFGNHARHVARRHGLAALAGAVGAIIVIFGFAKGGPGTARAEGTANLNPAAIAYTLPSQLKWVTQPNGAINAVLRGDPSKRLQVGG